MHEPTHEFEHGYTCNQVVELATDYVEHALPAELVEPFEMHLNFCDGCFTFIEQIRTTAELGGRLAEEEIPDETKAKLLAAFRDWQRR
jgi:Putative zinc-finger